MENFAACVHLDDGGEAEYDDEADGNGGDAVNAEEEPDIGFTDDHAAEVFGGAEMLGPFHLACVEEFGQRDPPVQIPIEDLETERLNVAKEVANRPAKRLVAVESVLSDDVAYGSEDQRSNSEVEVTSVKPFSRKSLRGGK